MIWDTIGVTGWTLPQIMALTMLQLAFVQRGRGRILYPRLEPMLHANLRELSDEPGPNGEPSGVSNALQGYEDRKTGYIRPMTHKEERTARAKRILLSPYLGDPDGTEAQQQAQATYPGMGLDEAQSWVAYVKSGRCSAEVWLEICDAYPAIFNTAKGKSPQ